MFLLFEGSLHCPTLSFFWQQRNQTKQVMQVIVKSSSNKQVCPMAATLWL